MKFVILIKMHTQVMPTEAKWDPMVCEMRMDDSES